MLSGYYKDTSSLDDKEADNLIRKVLEGYVKMIFPEVSMYDGIGRILRSDKLTDEVGLREIMDDVNKFASSAHHSTKIRKTQAEIYKYAGKVVEYIRRKEQHTNAELETCM